MAGLAVLGWLAMSTQSGGRARGGGRDDRGGRGERGDEAGREPLAAVPLAPRRLTLATLAPPWAPLPRAVAEVDAVRVGTAMTTAAAEATLAAGRTDEEVVAGLLVTTMDGR